MISRTWGFDTQMMEKMYKGGNFGKLHQATLTVIVGHDMMNCTKQI